MAAADFIALLGPRQVILICVGILVLAIVVAKILHRVPQKAKNERANKILDFLGISDSEGLRAAALAELGTIDSEIARSAVVAALNDRHLAVRVAAIESLCNKGRSEASRLQIAKRLARSGAAPASLAYWIKLIKDLTEPERTLRNYILPGLMAAAKDLDPRIRSAAVAALRDIGTPEAFAAINASAQSPSSGKIECSAFYPESVPPETWHTVYAYICKASAKESVRADLAARAGLNLESYDEAKKELKDVIGRGALVNVSLLLDGVVINPPTITIGFVEDWHRFEFRIRVPESHPQVTVLGEVSFSIEGLIVAEVPILFEVTPNLVKAEGTFSTTAPYEAVFCSYSNKDEHIVRRMEAAYKALGMDIVRDVVILKSGEQWSEQLSAFIAHADVFQLFWSANASVSTNVRREWQYALHLAHKKPRFIRPVYWHVPMPPAPPELADIHFAYHPELADEDKRSTHG